MSCDKNNNILYNATAAQTLCRTRYPIYTIEPIDPGERCNE